MSAQFIANSSEDWKNFKSFVWDRFEFPVLIEYKQYSGMRTISQNRLQHMWYSQMAQYFTAKGFPLTQLEAKKLMKHEFLGYEDVKIGSTEINGQLRSTASLEKGEASEYMDKIDAWCVDKGLFLIKPVDSEYMKLKEAQIGS